MTFARTRGPNQARRTRDLSSVCFLILKRMTDIEKRLAGNGDDGNLIERQLFRRASVKRKSRRRPIENRIANLTSLRFARYFNDDDPGFIASRIMKFNM